MKLQEFIEEYLLTSAEAFNCRGLPAINLWSLYRMDRRNIPFDGVFTDGEISAISRPLKVTVATPGDNKVKGFILRSFRQVAAPTRGFCARPHGRPNFNHYNKAGKWVQKGEFLNTQNSSRTRWPRYKVQESFGFVESRRNGQLAKSLTLNHFSHDGKSWTGYYQNGKACEPDSFDGDLSKGDLLGDVLIPSIVGLQTFTEYCWTVEFRFDNKSAPILLPLTESAARRLKREASSPEGERKRRIVHFVQEHRRGVDLDEKTARVMRHMRGKQFYLWQGCHMKIMPPVNDMYSFERDTEKIKSVRKAVFATH